MRPVLVWTRPCSSCLAFPRPTTCLSPLEEGQTVPSCTQRTLGPELWKTLLRRTRELLNENGLVVLKLLVCVLAALGPAVVFFGACR